jgi:hypothetical protein
VYIVLQYLNVTACFLEGRFYIISTQGFHHSLALRLTLLRFSLGIYCLGFSTLSLLALPAGGEHALGHCIEGLENPSGRDPGLFGDGLLLWVDCTPKDI